MTHYPRFIDPPSPQHIRQDGSFPVTFFHEDLDLSKQLSTEFKLSLYFFLTTLSFSIGARTISNWTSISSPVHSKVRCGIFFFFIVLKRIEIRFYDHSPIILWWIALWHPSLLSLVIVFILILDWLKCLLYLLNQTIDTMNMANLVVLSLIILLHLLPSLILFLLWDKVNLQVHFWSLQRKVLPRHQFVVLPLLIL